jgi:NTP pyrophosphatase (non-canonical NTP hydrolase)
VVENIGVETYDVVWNLLALAEIVGVNLEETFDKKARLNEDREW